MKPIHILSILALTFVLAQATPCEAQQYNFTTLAGPAGGAGYADGTGSDAQFAGPSGVAVDSAGNVYVADTDNQTIRKITSAGVVSTLAGLAGSPGSSDGRGSAARFAGPSGMAADSAGNVYVADTWEAKNIRIGTPVLVTLPRLNSNSLVQVPNEPFQFEVTASTNQLVFIQAASVLPATDWNTIQTVTLWNGRSTISDPGAPDFPIRFYRGISPVP